MRRVNADVCNVYVMAFQNFQGAEASIYHVPKIDDNMVQPETHPADAFLRLDPSIAWKSKPPWRLSSAVKRAARGQQLSV